MDPSGIVIGAIGLLMAGVAVIAVTRAASTGGIDVNSAIGIRTRTTKSSQRAWELAHRAALPWAWVTFLLTVATSVVSVAAVIMANSVGSSRVAPAVVLVSGYAGLVLLMSVATSVANRAVRETGERDEERRNATDR